jgi:hypothetical protein
MPSMTGYSNEVEKALFLRRFGVPFWGLSYVFGRDDTYWDRMVSHFGQLVSTTLKDPAQVPEQLLADEKHLHFNGEKGYIATTVGGDCVLGVSLAADEAALTQAYADFRQQANRLAPDYAPKTVTTDGGFATQNAWRTLFPAILVLVCFLHAFLKIRNRCKHKWQTLFPTIQQKVWDSYHASDANTFRQRTADLLTWSQQSLTGPALEAVHKLCAKTDSFVLAFEHPYAFRTSNMADRPMQPLDRWLLQSRFFHGDWRSAQLQCRAWALFHNFLPYCPRASANHQHQCRSPVEKLNRFVYLENWLHNLLISTSVAGCSLNHRFRQN